MHADVETETTDIAIGAVPELSFGEGCLTFFGFGSFVASLESRNLPQIGRFVWTLCFEEKLMFQ